MAPEPSLPADSKDGERLGSAKSDDSWTSWSEYNLEWLFDPNRYNHLPIEEQLKLFKQPDLRRTKIFKTAAKIWGAPVSRKRRIIASMIQPDSDLDPVERPPIQLTSALKPQCPPPKKPSSTELRVKEEKEKLDAHSKWMQERRAFRQNIDSIGINEQWLANKPDRTNLENRVLEKFIADRTVVPPSPPPKVDPPIETHIGTQSPVVQRPSPLGIRIIERYLREKRMRLIDLFARVDKNKNWVISRDEFRDTIQRAGIPISDVLLEDLILSLDSDLDNELDYRELATGMGLWKIEKRETKRGMLANPKTLHETFEEADFTDCASRASLSPLKSSSAKSRTKSGVSTVTGDVSPMRVKSAVSAVSSGSGSQYLDLPENDLRPEQRILSSEEAMVDVRKRDRETLARYNSRQKAKENSAKFYYLNSGEKRRPDLEKSKTIVTGDKAIDDHCRLSTLDGETGKLVNKFRQLKLQEYEEICGLCRENNVPLSEPLLKKALLYPPDNPRSQIMGKVRQPSQKLYSSKFASRSSTTPTASSPKADSPKKMKQKIEKHRKDYKDLYGPGSYPSARTKVPRRFKMHLSTGKAIISRQVNCWLTYEEYERLTRDLSRKYDQMHGPSDDNAFWPGHLLKKLRLCMDCNCCATDNKNAVFSSIRQEKRSNVGYHNDLNTWPSDLRCVKYGGIDK